MKYCDYPTFNNHCIRTGARRIRYWTTDAVYMPNSRKIAVATTGRDIRFVDVTSTTFVEDFHLFSEKFERFWSPLINMFLTKLCFMNHICTLSHWELPSKSYWSKHSFNRFHSNIRFITNFLLIDIFSFLCYLLTYYQIIYLILRCPFLFKAI